MPALFTSCSRPSARAARTRTNQTGSRSIVTIRRAAPGSPRSPRAPQAAALTSASGSPQRRNRISSTSASDASTRASKRVATARTSSVSSSRSGKSSLLGVGRRSSSAEAHRGGHAPVRRASISSAVARSSSTSPRTVTAAARTSTSPLESMRARAGSAFGWPARARIRTAWTPCQPAPGLRAATTTLLSSVSSTYCVSASANCGSEDESAASRATVRQRSR